VPKDLLQPHGGWNVNVWMFVSAIAILIISNCGYWLNNWYGGYCFMLNVIALHLAGTIIHDACHHAGHKNRIINAILGHGSALMLGFAFPVFTRVHLQHHSHVNDPKNDPDHFVSTMGPLWLIAVRFLYHEVFFFRRQLWRKYELLEWFLSRLVVISIVLLSLHYSFWDYILTYWFLAAFVVGIILGLFFDYFPHRPFGERDRWKNARVYPNKILNLLIGGQNYHLVHHLWPSIPWYKYEEAYYITKPLLDEKECDQVLGILQSKKDFWNFIYDVFIGIRLGSH
jgi:beta-carotene hydroxylase